MNVKLCLLNQESHNGGVLFYTMCLLFVKKDVRYFDMKVLFLKINVRYFYCLDEN